MTETTKTDRLLISEHVPGDASEETIELLLHNLRDQVLARCTRAGYVVDPGSVRGIVRGQPGGQARRIEVWAPYQQHTVEHRRALSNAYEDGLNSARAYRAVTTDELVPRDEKGEPLTGHAWAEYVKALAECPYEVGDPQPGNVAAVLVAAWCRGWAEAVDAHDHDRQPAPSPYMRTVRP